jgi:selenocysteine lyase/cysteine desulfurase
MEQQRDKFNLKEGVSYINCAYMGPLLRSSEEKGIEGLKRKRNPFEVSQEDFFKDIAVVKELFGELVNAPASQIALFPSVSYGFSSVLNNLSSDGKTEAIVVSNEFPSGYFSAKSWCEKHDCNLNVIEPQTISSRNQKWSDDIIASINKQTAFVLISSVHWMDGTKFDLEKIGATCKQLGAKLLIDGTQSVGALPMDVQKFQIDALVCATYKWLFGPYSSAIGYISPSFEKGIPLEESWMNRTNAYDFSLLTNYEDAYVEGAGRYNMGESNDFIKMPILIASFQQILEWKPAEIQAYCQKLVQPIVAFFEENGIHIEDEKYQAQHLIGFKLEGKFQSEQLFEDLKVAQIFLSFRGDFLRISPNVYNTEEDMLKLLQVLRKNLIVA